MIRFRDSTITLPSRHQSKFKITISVPLLIGMKVQILMFYQDDPKKCTAAKMVKFGLAHSIRKIGAKGMVLDPFAEKTPAAQR